MPRHPFISISRYTLEAVNRRIKFLDQFAERASDLPFISPEQKAALPDASPDDLYVGENVGDYDPAELAAMSALMTAAELSLLTDQTGEGRRLLVKALSRGTRGDARRWPVLRVAVSGAALGDVDVHLDVRGLTIKKHRPKNIIGTYPWRAPPTALFRKGGLFIAAAAASNGDNRFERLMRSSEDDETRLLTSALANTPESAILPLFVSAQDFQGGEPHTLIGETFAEARTAFYGLHQRYASRLRILLSTPRFFEGPVRDSLFDWGLFLLHLGFIRHHVGEEQLRFLPPSPTGTDAAQLILFMNGLAKEFDAASL